MYVTSSNGLYVRTQPDGQITGVLGYGFEVHTTGQRFQTEDRLWAEVDVPEQGWVALSFLTLNQPEPTPTTGEPPTLADWAALRFCESSGNYGAVSNPPYPGAYQYHGAYQFNVETWDDVANGFWPELVGIVPSQASPADQDKMALKLFDLRGAQPWPVCGSNLL